MSFNELNSELVSVSLFWLKCKINSKHQDNVNHVLQSVFLTKALLNLGSDTSQFRHWCFLKSVVRSKDLCNLVEWIESLMHCNQKLLLSALDWRHLFPLYSMTPYWSKPKGRNTRQQFTTFNSFWFI